MEVKVGQWVRTDLGNIIQPSKIEIDKSIWECNDRLFYDTLTCTIIKVANTPQELIEVGDLVEVECWISNTKTIRSLSTQFNYDVFREWENINQCATKILTPNSNGGYDLQWSAELEGYNE